MEDDVSKMQNYGGDYGSEFEYDSEADRKRKKRQDLACPAPAKKTKMPKKTEVTNEYSKEEWRAQRYHVLSMDAYSRHKKFVNDYMLYYCGRKSDFGRDTSRDRTDHDVIRENHRFLWTDEDQPEESWEKTMAKKYWDKLFKEYCIVDLSRYKENKVALRWQIEKEVVAGKGQFICGSRKCENEEGLRTWEVNFGYMEHGEKKNALVKLRLCPECSHKLNYHHQKREVTKTPSSKTSKHSSSKKDKQKKKKKRKHKHRRSRSQSPSSSQSDDNSQGDESSSSQSTNSDKIWQGPAKVTEEKSREEEFDDYFEDMFL